MRNMISWVLTGVIISAILYMTFKAGLNVALTANFGTIFIATLVLLGSIWFALGMWFLLGTTNERTGLEGFLAMVCFSSPLISLIIGWLVGRR